ncbi:pectinesterase inhibitor 4 [Eutrema salsugineum]|nr:pectinesterase inhibitor 4 [Eutrema salsugineum]
MKVATINMSQFLYSLMLIFVFLTSTNIKKTAAAPPSYSQNHKMFVKTACKSTTYPEKCYKSLSSYSSAIKSDPIKLCTTALNINVKSAKKATSVVSKLLKKSQKSAAGRKNKMLPETLILKDCLEEMKDTIVELKQAITEMKTLRDGDSVAEHISNVRTWVSAALTDEGTCTDGFEEVKVNKETKKKVTKVVEELARATSNTLALITNLRY